MMNDLKNKMTLRFAKMKKLSNNLIKIKNNTKGEITWIF